MGKVTRKEAREIARETVGKYPAGKPPAVIKAVPTGLSAREKEQISIKQPVEKIQKNVPPKTLGQIAMEKQAAKKTQTEKVFKSLQPVAGSKTKTPVDPAEEARLRRKQQDERLKLRQDIESPLSRASRTIAERERQNVREAQSIREGEEARLSAIKQWQESQINKRVQNPINEPGTKAWIEEQVAKNLKEIAEREKALKPPRNIRGGQLGGILGGAGGSFGEQVK